MAEFEHQNGGAMHLPVEILPEPKEEEPLFNPFAEDDLKSYGECDFYGVSSPDLSQANNPLFYL